MRLFKFLNGNQRHTNRDVSGGGELVRPKDIDPEIGVAEVFLGDIAKRLIFSNGHRHDPCRLRRQEAGRGKEHGNQHKWEAEMAMYFSQRSPRERDKYPQRLDVSSSKVLLQDRSIIHPPCPSLLGMNEGRRGPNIT